MDQFFMPANIEACIINSNIISDFILYSTQHWFLF